MNSQISALVATDASFWSRVEIGTKSACWPWTGAKKPKGYGNVTRGGKSLSTHRLAWTLAFGEIRDGMQVQHSCDNPSCCNPHHLMLGTVVSNYIDMVRKGRGNSGHPNRARGELHHASRLTDHEVREIRRRYALGGVRQTDLAKEFGVSQRTISLITRNEVRSDVNR